MNDKCKFEVGNIIVHQQCGSDWNRKIIFISKKSVITSRVSNKEERLDSIKYMNEQYIKVLPLIKVKFLHLPITKLSHHIIVQVVESEITKAGLMEIPHNFNVDINFYDVLDINFYDILRVEIKQWLYPMEIGEIELIETKELK